METLEELIRAQVKSARREPSPGVPNAAECLEVVRVAMTSVAAHVGIAPGDLVTSVNRRPASLEGARFYQNPASERSYQIYTPKTGERLRLETTGIELGMSVRPSMAAVTAQYRADDPDLGTLETLWEAGKWATLQRLCEQSVKPATGLARLKGKWVVKTPPCLVFLGAALHEQGKRKEGLELVKEYDEKHARFFPFNFMAVSRYVHGREAALQKKAKDALEHFQRASELHPSERISAAIQQLTGQRPEKALRWTGRIIPLAYDLPGFEGSPARVSLDASLATLLPGQLALIGFLGSVRTNAGYSEFMMRYAGFWPYLKERIPVTHILTQEPRRRVELTEVLRGEDTARKRNAAFTLVHDTDGKATATVMTQTSPWFLLLDGRKKVVYDGELDTVDLWDSIAAADREAHGA